MIGLGEMLVIGAAIVIFFTARQLPAAVKGLKKSAKAFRGGLEGDDDEEKRSTRDVSPKTGIEKGSSEDPGK